MSVTLYVQLKGEFLIQGVLWVKKGTSVLTYLPTMSKKKKKKSTNLLCKATLHSIYYSEKNILPLLNNRKLRLMQLGRWVGITWLFSFFYALNKNIYTYKRKKNK